MIDENLDDDIKYMDEVEQIRTKKQEKRNKLRKLYAPNEVHDAHRHSKISRMHIKQAKSTFARQSISSNSQANSHTSHS